jgi:hypothetical protein
MCPIPRHVLLVIFVEFLFVIAEVKKADLLCPQREIFLDGVFGSSEANCLQCRPEVVNSRLLVSLSGEDVVLETYLGIQRLVFEEFEQSCNIG